MHQEVGAYANAGVDGIAYVTYSLSRSADIVEPEYRPNGEFVPTSYHPGYGSVEDGPVVPASEAYMHKLIVWDPEGPYTARESIGNADAWINGISLTVENLGEELYESDEDAFYVKCYMENGELKQDDYGAGALPSLMQAR